MTVEGRCATIRAVVDASTRRSAASTSASVGVSERSRRRRASGGTGGGGACLTDAGRSLVADYRAIEPAYGTLADLDALVDAAHDRGIAARCSRVFTMEAGRLREGAQADLEGTATAAAG
jgi:molybdate transport repressor ModE-like protein